MMKKLLYTLTLVMFMIVVQGQSLFVESYMENTQMSPKLGTGIGYKFQGQFEIGGFLQRTVEVQKAENGRPLKHENELFGAFFSFPLLYSKQYDIQLKIRTGVSNRENFMISPSLKASHNLGKSISIGSGFGFRSYRPTFMASIQLKVFGEKN